MNKLFYIILILWFASCNSIEKVMKNNNVMTTEKILGNTDYQAICYGGYRTNTRDVQPTLQQLKEDMLILSAMKIKFIRTYNVHYDEVKNLLKVIKNIKKENPNFEMYVMLGAWIDCKNAWTDQPPIHNQESDRNAIEVAECVRLVNEFPEIIKVIAVGNEAMVNWATSYYVTPNIILKWVNHLQKLKKENKLPKDLWITSSDNFASWGGGEASYHVEDLKKLYEAVDYVSIHTYPMHDTHYNPVFWGINANENNLSDIQKIDATMKRALDYAKNQYKSVDNYMKTLGINKPIHIGETGWASYSDGFYGTAGSKACDEYKAAKYYELMREWTTKEKITCFYFEAFDENWKDKNNPQGSENHFGLFTNDGKAKFALWKLVDENVFNNLTRDGKKISKTYNGDLKELMKTLELPKTL
ncbi:MAG: glycosyl hydrolase family 17 protein [Flavobacterium sp.]